MIQLPHFNCLVPELAVLIGICALLMIDVLIRQRDHLITFFLAEVVIIIAAVLTIIQLQAPDTSIISFSGHFIRDNFSSILKLFIYLTVFVAFYFAMPYISERKIHQGEYYILGLFSMLGMMVLVSAHNLVTIYLGLELLSLPIYAMTALARSNTQSANLAVEAAIKYFMMGAFASGVLLYGMSMIYGAAHSLDISVIAQNTNSATGLTLGLYTFGIIFLVAGIAFKFGGVPFHAWVPDVYQGAPVSVAMLIGTAAEIAGFGMAIRLLANMLPGVAHDWQLWLIVIAIASMAVGNILAIIQTSIKRLLAYSAIAQMGYMSLGLLSATPEGYSAATFYVIIYALSTLAAFSLLTMLSKKSGIEIDSLDDLKGLNSRNPWMAFMMLLIMFSLAGIPPLVGFFAKVAVFKALVDAHLIWVACVAVLLAVIGAYYYLRVIKVMYFEAPLETTELNVEGSMWVVFTLNSLLLLVLGFFPSGLLTTCFGLF